MYISPLAAWRAAVCMSVCVCEKECMYICIWQHWSGGGHAHELGCIAKRIRDDSSVGISPRYVCTCVCVCVRVRVRACVRVCMSTHTHTHTRTGQKGSSTAFIATDSRGEPLLVLVPRGPQDTVEQFSLKLQQSWLQQSSQNAQRPLHRPLQPTKQTNNTAIRTIFTDVARAGGGEGEEAGGDIGGATRVEACGLEFVAALDGLSAVPVTDSSGICMCMHSSGICMCLLLI